MKPRRPFHQFSDNDYLTWQILFRRQWSQVQQYATRMYLEGVEKIGLTDERIPDFAQLNERIKDLVGWELVSTEIPYSSSQDWFGALKRREFLITEYIRDRKDIEYTPMPDIWHDAFGHLPFLANQWYADYLQKYGEIAMQFTVEERKSLSSLWWYTIEFGLIYEDGELKALGAGLMSSYAELQRAYAGDVELFPYNIEAFETLEQSPHEFHHRLFVLDSWEQLAQSAPQWVEAHGYLKAEHRQPSR